MSFSEGIVFGSYDKRHSESLLNEESDEIGPNKPDPVSEKA